MVPHFNYPLKRNSTTKRNEPRVGLGGVPLLQSVQVARGCFREKETKMKEKKKLAENYLLRLEDLLDQEGDYIDARWIYT